MTSAHKADTEKKTFFLIFVFV